MAQAFLHRIRMQTKMHAVAMHVCASAVAPRGFMQAVLRASGAAGLNAGTLGPLRWSVRSSH